MTTRDRRSTRWDAHRSARRAELVEAALAAVREHGAGAGMDDVAAGAGTSKTVVYRHFADRADLYTAVCARVAESVVRHVRAAMDAADPAGGSRAMATAAIAEYLRLVEADPEVYRYVVHRPLLERDLVRGGGDPVGDLVSRIGAEAAVVIAAHLAAHGRDTTAAAPWGHGLVGLVHAATDNWLAHPAAMSRDQLAAHLTDLAWAGLSGVLPRPKEVTA
ncbi:TetR family transcriptional regulator [Pseudonocardia humida]|uniref:TetR/AcrR family transcriptional regulator n=1 Tax=Pseudonocardia humida TaxID=2800819 RepID=A0ABT1AAM9_9PSEU|nr:TetR family transcriptional regulator [Pseudonocardia humida]MCO1660107.1 TetR/AcrR family transcriptional regulator [Pseudonocardia humida]